MEFVRKAEASQILNFIQDEHPQTIALILSYLAPQQAALIMSALPPDRQGEVFHRYILGVYALYERLTTEFPHVLFESCASGGARFDPGSCTMRHRDGPAMIPTPWSA